eukprot:4869139-Alexandrium_andersonii.AAC.1
MPPRPASSASGSPPLVHVQEEYYGAVRARPPRVLGAGAASPMSTGAGVASPRWYLALEPPSPRAPALETPPP